MAKKATEKGGEGERTKMKNFRLEIETLDDLDFIAKHYTTEFGIQVTRTAAIRLSARNERKRIQSEKPGK